MHIYRIHSCFIYIYTRASTRIAMQGTRTWPGPGTGPGPGPPPAPPHPPRSSKPASRRAAEATNANLDIDMAVRQTVAASNPARQNLVPTLRGEGGTLCVGALCGLPCAGSPWALWRLGVCLSKSTVKHKEFTTFVNIMAQMHGIVLILRHPP